MWKQSAITVIFLLLPFSQVNGMGQPGDAVLLAWQDVQKISPEDASVTRYFWVTDDSPGRRRRTWAAAAGMVNALSLSRRIVSPALLDDEGNPFDWRRQPKDEAWGKLTLMRVNLLHYRMTPEQWDKLGNPTLEPLFHDWLLYDGKWVRATAPWVVEPLHATPKEAKRYLDAMVGLTRATGSCRCPILEARNFVWQTAIDFDRDAGYYGWLGVKDQRSFERLIRLDRSLLPLREAVAKSGVANQPRVIERFGRNDGTWYTYDQVDQRAIDDRNPLEQVDPAKFKADAIEAIGMLDNGWRAAALIKIADGSLQQSAPDGVGYNHKSVTNDGKIHVFLTCWSCHDAAEGNGGLQPFKPFFRELYAEPGPNALAATHRKQLSSFEERYLTPLDPWAEIDKRSYAAAVEQATGQTPQQWAKDLVDTFNSWDAPLTLDAAASEYGVAPEALVLLLNLQKRNEGILDNTNANWVKPKALLGPIGRDQFAQSFNKGQLALRGIPTWPAKLKEQLRPWEVKR